MSRKSRIFINTISNVGINFAQVVSAFVMLPLIIKYFGKEVYGIRAYVGSIEVIFNFFAGAISLSLIKFVPELIAKKEEKSFNELINSITIISFILHLIVGTIIFTFPYYGFNWFNIPNDLQLLTRNIFQLIGVFFVLKFLAPAVTGILNGLEQFHLNNKITLISLSSYFLAYFITAYTRSTLVTFILIIQIGLFLETIIRIYFAFDKLPIKIRFKKPSFKRLRSFFGFNLFLISNQVSEHLMYTTDRLILQKVLGSSSVTEYHIAKKTHDFAFTLNMLPLSALFPGLSKAFATNDTKFIKKVNVSISILYNLICIPPLITLYLLYEQFIQLWIGNGFKDSIVAGKFFLLMLIVVAPFRMFSRSILAKGRVREIGWIKFVYSVINVFASYHLALRIGILGVIIPTFIFWALVYPLTLLFLMKSERFFNINILLRISYPYIILLIVVFFVDFLAIFSAIVVNNWFAFILYFAAVYLATVMIIYLTSNGDSKAVIKLQVLNIVDRVKTYLNK